jgi:hypothetical protein
MTVQRRVADISKDVETLLSERLRGLGEVPLSRGGGLG